MKRTVLNKILLLRLIELSKCVSSYRKVAQMVYIIQEEGRREERVTFNYEFVKWHSEPYSAELEKDLQQLHLERLIQKTTTVEITDKGRALTHKMDSVFQSGKIDSFLKFFAYLHMKETLFETFAHIADKYDMVKYPIDVVVSPVWEEEEEEEPMDTVDITLLKEQIEKRFQELEEEDEEHLQKAEKILFNETTT